MLQRIQTYPVPDSVLEGVLNEISESRIPYIARTFSLRNNTYLSRANSMISPAVLLEVYKTSPSLKGQLLRLAGNASTPTIRRPLSLYLKFDAKSFPTGLDPSSDICLARVVEKTWLCEQRNYSLTGDGFMRFSVRELGIYAAIINPNPDIATAVAASPECGFMCENGQTLRIVVMALLLLLALVIYSFCVCCSAHDKKRGRAEAEQRKIASILAAQTDSFHGRKHHAMPQYLTQTEFGPKELAIDKVKEVIDRVDLSDPPLMPGQVVVYLANQHEVQRKQIEELKVQLMEQNEREKENLKLIKRIFHQKQLLYEQMQVSSELKS